MNNQLNLISKNKYYLKLNNLPPVLIPAPKSFIDLYKIDIIIVLNFSLAWEVFRGIEGI